jgi:hypothetical protein
MTDKTPELLAELERQLGDLEALAGQASRRAQQAQEAAGSLRRGLCRLRGDLLGGGDTRPLRRPPIPPRTAERPG